MEKIIYEYMYEHTHFVLAGILVWLLLSVIMEYLIIEKKNLLYRIWKVILFVVLLVGIYAFLEASILHRVPYENRICYLDLFWSYRDMVENDIPFFHSDIFWNIVGFIPLGNTLTLLMGEKRSWLRILCIVFGASLSIECTQFLFKIGIFELDDLFNNTLGGMIGYWIALFCLIPKNHRKRE